MKLPEPVKQVEPVDDTPAWESPITKKEEPRKVAYAPVSEESLRELLLEGNWPTDIKVRVVDIVQLNNKAKIGSYTIDFIPGELIKIENGVVTKHVP